MPRTCLACQSPVRREIDTALARGEPHRRIAKRVSISPAGILRHKAHVALAITKIQEKREVKLGDSILEGIRQLQEKALDLLGKMEQDGDYRGAILAAREARESLLSANELLAQASTLNGAGICEVRVIHIGAKDESGPGNTVDCKSSAP